MPADTKAKYYTWYMTDDSTERIVAFEWWPEGEFVSSMTVGKMYFKKRATPDDVWDPPFQVGNDVLPWVVAQNIARREGFNVEVAVQS